MIGQISKTVSVNNLRKGLRKLWHYNKRKIAAFTRVIGFMITMGSMLRFFDERISGYLGIGTVMFILCTIGWIMYILYKICETGHND